MKQFNLEEYLRLKEEGKEPHIVTRNGHSARIVCTDVQDEKYPVLALFCHNGIEDSLFTNAKGRDLGEQDSRLDLFFADLDPEPKYRPYKDADECFRDVLKHGGWVKDKAYPNYQAIYYMSKRGVSFQDYNGLLEGYVWADDGSPCGVKGGEA